MARSSLPRKRLGRHSARAAPIIGGPGPRQGRMTALQSKKQGEKNNVSPLTAGVLFVTKSPPLSIQRGVWPRVRCLRTRVQRRQESRNLLIRRHPNHLQHHIRPRRQNTLTPRSGRHKYAKLPIEIRKKACRYTFQKYATQCSPPPCQPRRSA